MWKDLATRVVFTLALVGMGCASIDAPATHDLPGMPASEHALVQPRGSAEQLLGRPVFVGSDGQVVIADSRTPGCEVVTNEVPAQWRRHFSQELRQAGVLEAGRLDVAGLEARHGEALRVEAEVVNDRVLRADLRGPCGANVVKAVFVGSGWREVQFRRESSGRAVATFKGVTLAGGAGSWERLGGRLEWSQPQAWAFQIGSSPNYTDEIELQMPVELVSGSTFTPVATVRRSAWLIVLYRDADGNYGVVLPSSDAPEYRVEAGVRVLLPTLRATVLPGHRVDYETLVVYGFQEEGDFARFRPPPGVLNSEQATEYALGLRSRLEDPTQIPRARWASTEFGYRVVKPRKGQR